MPGDDHPKRNVRIEGVMAKAFFGKKNMFLMDPDNPTVDADALLRARHGAMLDPRHSNWNCPLCNRTMAFELFCAHAEPCARKWFKTLDPTLRKYSGPQDTEYTMPERDPIPDSEEDPAEKQYPEKSTNIIGVVATATAEALAMVPTEAPAAAEIPDPEG